MPSKEALKDWFSNFTEKKKKKSPSGWEICPQTPTASGEQKMIELLVKVYPSQQNPGCTAVFKRFRVLAAGFNQFVAASLHIPVPH